MDERPIANKYCEGKMKRTLKRRSKELEIVKREADMRGAIEHGLERGGGKTRDSFTLQKLRFLQTATQW